MKNQILLDCDPFYISSRIKEVDENYFIVFNTARNVYELHSSAQIGSTYALTIPYSQLDERTIFLRHPENPSSRQVLPKWWRLLKDRRYTVHTAQDQWRSIPHSSNGLLRFQSSLTVKSPMESLYGMSRQVYCFLMSRRTTSDIWSLWKIFADADAQHLKFPQRSTGLYNMAFPDMTSIGQCNKLEVQSFSRHIVEG